MTIICKYNDLSIHQTEVIEQSQVASYLKHEQALLWIEMKLHDSKELDWLGQTFALHPSTVKLVQSKADYPAFDWQEEYYVFATTAVRVDEQQVLHVPGVSHYLPKVYHYGRIPSGWSFRLRSKAMGQPTGN